MVPDVEMWSPERELRLLEEMAETEAKAFDIDLGLPTPAASGGGEQVWVAYWYLPPDGIRPKPRQARRSKAGRAWSPA
jgi:hypothetical protein